ncbi:bifunctional biotin--[acetyl-CoA-carboxylase] ligase/biotin operon repressor BirA [Lysobacter sp. A3-1-A15]|uniref:bifunctional biotin--[acetyl-CoA-carboxylase] ligase/biotin operon repressor BirA n=1 Tax=Novilysobacter viscosus TaxID=3098602 RepID=UPI002ED95DBC
MDDRAVLQRLIDGPLSGDTLAREAGQTRAAVWKRIQALRQAGVAIEARPGIGYALAQPMALLDPALIERTLGADARRRMASLAVAWTIDSTNSALMAGPVPADGSACVLLAERQTAGRGRRGRHWNSPLAAHLYLSLARSFGGGLSRLGGLSLVAGVATVEALHAMDIGRVRLKWPNDVVVVDEDGRLRKLGGLLVEGSGEHAGPVRAVIGLGLNVRMPAGAAALIDQPWCDLAGLDRGAAVDRNRLAAAVLEHWLPALAAFDRDGLAPFLARYAAVDALQGREVVVQGERGRIEGVARGITGDGGLEVTLPGGQARVFHAGEASLRLAGAREEGA